MRDRQAQGVQDFISFRETQSTEDRNGQGLFAYPPSTQQVHEAVLGRDLDKDVFRRQMLPCLEPTGRTSEHTVGRPARLFRRTG